jgi:membrane-bound serine protease (ClpP class)
MVRMRKKFMLILPLLLLFGVSIITSVKGEGSLVYTIEIHGTIDSGIANFIERSIEKAEAKNVPLIIKIDTPGGLLSATETIVKRMLDSKIKTVVWVTPPGRWAYSAGTFILLASDVAAMDDATIIGAAQPRPEDPKTTEAMVGWIREIASFRGRPQEVAENFVRTNLTLGPESALKSRVIELRARSVQDILDYIGMPAASVEQIEMDLFSQVLRLLSNPDIVVILFLAGIFGIIAEITTPGVGFPGVAGVICLLLGLWGLGALEINVVGVIFIILGAALLVAEALTPGFGIFGIGGAISLLLGFMMLGEEPWVEMLGIVIKGLAVGIVIVLLILVAVVRGTKKKPIKVGKEELIGAEGVVIKTISPKGLVKLRGELWTASSSEKIKPGEKVVVKDIRGLELIVERRD